MLERTTLTQTKQTSIKKQKPGICNASEQSVCFLELLARAARELHLVGPSLERREACLMLLFPSGFGMRSDVLAVVEVGRIQAVIMPLTPLLHCLPGPLFLL